MQYTHAEQQRLRLCREAHNAWTVASAFGKVMKIHESDASQRLEMMGRTIRATDVLLRRFERAVEQGEGDKARRLLALSREPLAKSGEHQAAHEKSQALAKDAKRERDAACARVHESCNKMSAARPVTTTAPRTRATTARSGRAPRAQTRSASTRTTPAAPATATTASAVPGAPTAPAGDADPPDPSAVRRTDPRGHARQHGYGPQQIGPNVRESMRALNLNGGCDAQTPPR